MLTRCKNCIGNTLQACRLHCRVQTGPGSRHPRFGGIADIGGYDGISGLCSQGPGWSRHAWAKALKAESLSLHRPCSKFVFPGRYSENTASIDVMFSLSTVTFVSFIAMTSL